MSGGFLGFLGFDGLEFSQVLSSCMISNFLDFLDYGGLVSSRVFSRMSRMFAIFVTWFQVVFRFLGFLCVCELAMIFSQVFQVFSSLLGFHQISRRRRSRPASKASKAMNANPVIVADDPRMLHLLQGGPEGGRRVMRLPLTKRFGNGR